MLFKGAVEGPERIEACRLTDIDDSVVRLTKQAGGKGDSQGVYIVIEAYIQLFTEEVRDIVS